MQSSTQTGVFPCLSPDLFVAHTNISGLSGWSSLPARLGRQAATFPPLCLVLNASVQGRPELLVAVLVLETVSRGHVLANPMNKVRKAK